MDFRAAYNHWIFGEMEDVVASPAPLATDLSETESRFSNTFLRLKKQLMRKTGEAIVDYGMIVEGDVVMVCVSGGKDSLRLMGMLSGEKTEVCLGETVLESLPDGDAALVRMAAALEIRELITTGQQEKALGLSLRHQLVNELTSSLMVLKRAASSVWRAATSTWW